MGVAISAVLALLGYTVMWVGQAKLRGRSDTSLADAFGSCPKPDRSQSDQRRQPGITTVPVSPTPQLQPQAQPQSAPMPQTSARAEGRPLPQPAPPPQPDIRTTLQGQAQQLLDQIQRGAVGITDAVSGLAKLMLATERAAADAVRSGRPFNRSDLDRILAQIRGALGRARPIPRFGAGGAPGTGFQPPPTWGQPSGPLVATQRDM